MAKIEKLLESHSFQPEFIECLAQIEKQYGFDLFQVSGIGKQLDINWYAKQWFGRKTNTADVSVDANSNVGLKNVVVWDNELSKPLKLIYSYYRMWKGLKKKYSLEYANEAVTKQLTGEIYINDFHGFASNLYYCYNYCTLDIAHQGIPKGIDAEPSNPTKYLNTYMEHLQLFLVHAGSSSLGATSIADFLLTISAYVKRILTVKGDQHVNFVSEEDCWTFVREKLTNFVYFLNQPNRIVQSLFSNVSIYDDAFLDTLVEHYCIEDGDNYYFAEKDIVKKVQQIFIEVMQSIMKVRLITFPVVTACFSLDEERNIQDEDFLRWVLKVDKEYRFINLYGGATSTLSSCCRLRSDKTAKYFMSSIGSSGTRIGSLGVVSQNLPRLAYKCKGNLDEFKRLLGDNIRLGQRINGIKRGILKKAIDNKMIPVYNLGFVDLKTQFQTTGVVGIYEALEILGYDIKTEEGAQLAEDLLTFISDTTDEMASEMKVPCNVEQIPAENVAVKLAKKDKMLGYNDKYEIYSNQYIPLKDMDADLFTRIKLVARLDKYMSGGSILHININEEVADDETFVQLAKQMYKMGVVYFAFNKLLAICNEEGCNHVFTTNKETFDANEVVCPHCGSHNTECALRVVGFIRKLSSWSSERQEEGKQRKFYSSLTKIEGK